MIVSVHIILLDQTLSRLLKENNSVYRACTDTVTVMGPCMSPGDSPSNPPFFPLVTLPSSESGALFRAIETILLLARSLCCRDYNNPVVMTTTSRPNFEQSISHKYRLLRHRAQRDSHVPISKYLTKAMFLTKTS
ncbi:hypothetical protein NPIL_666821 [Nephila pilipes]|uniref:Uncharacterized protein n=1 Tax=Nephila pilipes TaxID=299642 RepID=A0A8X6PF22_NEPPI|nr:hypothetical protein NPIL_666821 [Nephila pilipes]